MDKQLTELVGRVVEEFSKYGIEVSKSEILRTFMELSLLEFMSEDTTLGDELRLQLLTRLLKHYAEMEKNCYQAYKAFLRSNEYIVQDHAKMLDDGTYAKKSRYERLTEIYENADEDKKKALLGILNLRHYYAERIQEVSSEIAEILQKHGKLLTIGELLKKEKTERKLLTDDVYF